MKSSRLSTNDPDSEPDPDSSKSISSTEKKWNNKTSSERVSERVSEGVSGSGPWIEKYSESHKRKFWKNTETGKSTWTDPHKTPKKKEIPLTPSLTHSTSKKKELPVGLSTSTTTPPSSPPPPSPSSQSKKTLLSTAPPKPPRNHPKPTPSLATQSTTTSSSSATNTPPPPTESLDKSPPPPAPPAATESLTHSSKAKKQDRFSGGIPLQFGMWGHYMSVGCSLLCLWFGIVAVLWDDHAYFYGCKIDGEFIHEDYILRGPEFGVLVNTCNVRYKGEYICCDPNNSPDIEGFAGLGYIYIIFALVNFFYIENTSYGWGLFAPNSTPFFERGFSPLGIFHILLGICGLASYTTVLPAVCLMSTGVVYNISARNREVGDGGRARARQQRESARAKRNDDVNPDFDTVSHRMREACSDGVTAIKGLNPIAFLRRIYNEDKVASYFWVTLFFALNIFMFFYTLGVWNGAVQDMKDGLLEGTLEVGDTCSSDECVLNRFVIKTGPISDYGPWAKSAGGCLNLDCALVLLPVIKMILSKLNNAGVNASRYSKSSNIITQFFNRPITRYIPLQKNIEFHKLCAFTIFFFAWMHTMFHCLNLMKSSTTTLNNFAWLGWQGTDFLTGAIISLAMFFIYSAAPNAVRHSNFEIFFYNHHWFVVFFLMLFIHGPVFFYWACVPVTLYIIERYLQTQRGSRPFVVTKVEWIPPVMAIQFRPVIKDHFVFKEGQYLYLNCPFLSKSEWHPFTISSASGDLENGPRILLETGERVYPVPKPKNWPDGAKWSKFCVISKDYKTLSPEFLVDKCDTGYLDYVSVHIKVHGLDDPNSKSWTKKLKEYFEMMNPPKIGSDGNFIPGSNFPFYFLNRDRRGDLSVGKQYGPDGSQILCVDGPHSAPAEHYVNYGTVMLIGAGIGLTPCVSILSSLLKYRWQKNFTPEILHFYWVVRHNEIESFQWLVHTLTELQYELHRQRQVGQVSAKHYCEINIFVTAYNPRNTKFVPRPLHKASGSLQQFTGCSDASGTQDNVNVTPLFDAEELYEGLIHPTVSSKEMVTHMKAKYSDEARNTFQDIRVWNGRPVWDDIFHSMRDNREHPDIGVCFCGAPVIGADLKTMCEKYSSVEDDCMFSLHKENF